MLAIACKCPEHHLRCLGAGDGMRAVVSTAQEVQASRSAGQPPDQKKQQRVDGQVSTNGKHVPGVANGGVQKQKEGKKAKQLTVKQQRGIALAAALEAKAQKRKANKRSKMKKVPRAGGS